MMAASAALMLSTSATTRLAGRLAALMCYGLQALRKYTHAACAWADWLSSG